MRGLDGDGARRGRVRREEAGIGGEKKIWKELGEEMNTKMRGLGCILEISFIQKLEHTFTKLSTQYFPSNKQKTQNNNFELKIRFSTDLHENKADQDCFVGIRL